MTVIEKIQVIDNKVEQNSCQYDLDKQSTYISALSSGYVSKYEFLIGEYVLPGKCVLEEHATIKEFAYSPLAKQLKAQ